MKRQRRRRRWWTGGKDRGEHKQAEEMVQWRSISQEERNNMWKELCGTVEEEVLEKYIQSPRDEERKAHTREEVSGIVRSHFGSRRMVSSGVPR